VYYLQEIRQIPDHLTDSYNSLCQRYPIINQINGIPFNFLVGNSNMADARSHEAETTLARFLEPEKMLRYINESWKASNFFEVVFFPAMLKFSFALVFVLGISGLVLKYIISLPTYYV